MTRIILVLAVLMGFLSFSAKAEVIVVAVSGTEAFVPGQELNPASEILVPEGARITILSKSGTMRAIDGPYNGAPLQDNTADSGSSDASGQWDVMKSFLGHPDARSEVLGVSRGSDGEVPPPPGIWHVSIDSSGPRCTKSGGLTFWRRDADETQIVSLRNASSSLKDVNWPAGEATMTVPDIFEVETGRLIVSIDGDLRDLDMHVFPGTVEDVETGTLLSWFVDKNCKRQAWSLVRLVHLKP
ncbi:MAG: hypothetical protein AAF478_10520 [Pseudomonadota bacterium]